MSLRRAAVLLAGAWSTAAVATAATTFPQTVEVDLVFPRNETYAPSAIFPVVFALQNPALVPSLDPGFQLELWQNVAHNNSLDLPNIDLGSVNFTNSTGPLYVYTYALNINTTNSGADTTTQYNLAWSFSAGNCSAGTTSTEAASFGGGFVFNNVIFTIAKEGGATPSINTTDSSSCKDQSYLAFNLTGTLTVPNPSTQWDGHASCAEFSDTTPTPASGNPCAAMANASVAASILSGATSSACAAATPAISCPAKKSSAAMGASVPMTVYTASAWAVLALMMAL